MRLSNLPKLAMKLAFLVNDHVSFHLKAVFNQCMSLCCALEAVWSKDPSAHKFKQQRMIWKSKSCKNSFQSRMGHLIMSARELSRMLQDAPVAFNSCDETTMPFCTLCHVNCCVPAIPPALMWINVPAKEVKVVAAVKEDEDKPFSQQPAIVASQQIEDAKPMKPPSVL